MGALVTGAFSAHVMLQWAWQWDTSLLGWNLLISSCAIGFGLGFYLPPKVARFSSFAYVLGFLPWWQFNPYLGLLGIALLLLGWSGFLRNATQEHYVAVGYGSAAGAALAYLVIFPHGWGHWLWVGGMLCLAVCPTLKNASCYCLVFILVCLQFLVGIPKETTTWLARAWTPHGWLVVWDSQGDRYLGFQRGQKLAPQSRMRLATPNQPQDYVKSATQVFLTDASAEPTVLDLGTGGGAFARWASEQSPHVTSVDASKAIWSVVPKHFPMPDSVNWVFADARHYLQRTEGTYDWVYVDLYRFNEPPSHTLTKEFWKLLSSRTHSDSIIVVNVITTEDWWGPLASTFRSVFPEAQFLPLNNLQGMLIVAPKLPKTNAPFPASQPPLTDDRNYVIK